MSNPLPTPPSNDIPGGLIKASDVSTLYDILSGNATNSISVDGAITASDVINAGNGVNVSAGTITAGGGLSVPSGQTATVAGTLGVTGTATIPNATANDEPVALGQLLNTDPIGASAGSSSATSVSATTGTFTAPSNGILFIFAQASATTAVLDPSSSSLSTSLAGLTTFGANTQTSTLLIYPAYLPMTAGQSTTITASAGTSSATNLVVSVYGFFIPFP